MSLPVFGFVACHERPLADGMACEAEWLAAAAASGRAQAHLWRGATGLVVPKSYERRPGFAAACQRWAAAGRPVQVRSSGGGLVPQGPGVLNLSLAWRTDPAAAPDPEGVYRALCAELAAAFARLGLAASPQAVEGSWCDGRFNLAAHGRKLVGTAQRWARVAGHGAVLAHAVVVVDADPVALTGEANAFEAAIGGARVYRAEALTSIAAEAGPAAAARCRQVLAEQFARVLPPVAHAAP